MQHNKKCHARFVKVCKKKPCRAKDDRISTHYGEKGRGDLSIGGTFQGCKGVSMGGGDDLFYGPTTRPHNNLLKIFYYILLFKKKELTL